MSGGGFVSSEALSPERRGGKGSDVDKQRPPTREERLAAKLRENLRRRKAQARALEDKGSALPNAPEES